ncbi:proteophosphoglycan ppg4 [Lentinula edodes]|uniref:Proteophosphoglycan ppg4 n=1 Tax=Lentinula edodes TaxID=5353 RepID=A0A1Q3E9D7_LENED|nr:proteophosphoglycan ppg4 [Lentinula edodes]
MKTLDRHNELNALPGLPFTTRNLPPHGPSRGSPPRLRNREKSSQRNVIVSPRSSSPPPLPKSVSLPLHAPRTTQSLPERNGPHALAHSHSSPMPSEQINKPAATTPTSFDQSPRVVELLHQISASKSTILDLRGQLNEYHSAASQSHASLQADLVAFRERKRQEDTTKNDLKARTKTLEDSKRTAESAKRDSEKRLRSAESARHDAAQRIEHLDKEITQLQNRLADDTAFLTRSQNFNLTSEAEQMITTELEHKKKEIRVAENVVTALSLRARELEERLAEKKERVRLMLERVEAQKQEQAIPPSSPVEHYDTWSPTSDIPDNHFPVHSHNSSGYTGSLDTDDVSHNYSGEMPVSRSSKSSLNLVSDFKESSLSTARPVNQVQGYFERPMNVLGRPPLPLNFSPFEEMPQTPAVVISPSTSSSLISSSLISSLDDVDGLSRSFQSESDIFLERDWKEKKAHGRQQSLQQPEGNIVFRVFAPRGHDGFAQLTDNSLKRNNSESFTSVHINADLEPVVADKTHNRRWFSLSAKTKAKKGLNPDAKVFDFNRSQNKSVPVPVMQEREALQRALGGSSNGSLERLPSLSDVGSIPSSPSHIHAKSVDHASPPFEQPQRHVPSWLQSLPRIRKPNFSPWDDEESAPTSTTVVGGPHRFLGGGKA